MLENIAFPNISNQRPSKRKPPTTIEAVLHGDGPSGKPDASTMFVRRYSSTWLAILRDKDGIEWYGLHKSGPSQALYEAARKIRIRDVLRDLGALAIAERAADEYRKWTMIEAWRDMLNGPPPPFKTATGRIFDYHHFSEEVRYETGVGMSMDEIDAALANEPRARKLDDERWELLNP